MALLERNLPLAELDAMLRDAADGTGWIALVGGEAGIGKTSLVAALAKQARGARLWWGGCDALGTPHPLAPLHDIARGEHAGFAPLLASGERSRLFESVLDELRRGPAPTLFVVEDAHWADEATLDLLKFLGRRIRGVPCLLVVTYRDDEPGASHPLRQLAAQLPPTLVRRIELARLSPDAVAQLARGALRAPEGVHAITQGNPFFVSELLRHDTADVPRGVQDLVLARLSRLSPAAQQVVRTASLVPARIERWLVDALLSPPGATLEECLDCGLLVEHGDGLAFRHELARAAVESALPSAIAAPMHARMLAMLEQEGAPASSLARRVHHALRADDAQGVLRLAPEAARLADARGAHKEAASHWRAALDCASTLPAGERAKLADALSYACYLTGRSGEALSARTQAQALWHAAGDALREGDSLRWLSRLSWYHGLQAPAEVQAARAIELLESLPAGAELAMAYGNRAQLHMLCGQHQDAIAWGRRALALAESLGDSETQVHLLNTIGTATLDSDEAEGLALLERSLAWAIELGLGEHAARAYTNLAFHAVVDRRDFARAWQWLDAGIAYCEERDLDAWGVYMAGYRAEALSASGDWTGALEQAEAVLRVPGAPPISRVLPLVVAARIHARRGDAQEQPPLLLDEALALAMPMSSKMRMGPVACARAEAAWLRGEPDVAAREIGLAQAFPRDAGYLAWIEGELAFWRARTGSPPEVPPHCPAPYALQIQGRWREAADAWQRLGCGYERARALAEGDVEARLLALDLFDAMGAQADVRLLREALRDAGVGALKRGRRASTQANPHGLTTRELEVLRLLCAGLRNAQIAERLHRSVRTIDHHVASVFAKLGVATRAEAIATAHAAGLTGAGAGEK